MIKATVDTSRLNQAVSEFIAVGGKAVSEEMARQGKFLAYELGASAPPSSNPDNGLSPSNKASVDNKVKRQLRFYIVPEGDTTTGLSGLLGALLRNDISDLVSYYMAGNWTFSLTGQTLWRIMRSVPTNPELAYKNLNQYLGKLLARKRAEYFESRMNPIEAYYMQIAIRARRGKSKVVKVSGPQGGEPKTLRLRAQIRSKALAAAGGVKAGWIQAGDKLPAKAAVSTPSWLAGKPQAGRSSLEVSKWKAVVTVANSNGNPAGLEDRTRYVQRAVDRRAAKVTFALEGAIKYLAQKSFKK